MHFLLGLTVGVVVGAAVVVLVLWALHWLARGID